MLYLLDADVLIDASRDYYRFDSVPQFWNWLIKKGEEGIVKIPIEIYEEIKEGSNEDALTKWAKDPATEHALLLNEEVNVSLVSKVVDEGYASDLTDDEVEQIGCDPFLIAYALASPEDRRVVTTEVSKPKKIRANRRVPDVCADFNIKCCHTFQFIRELNFKVE